MTSKKITIFGILLSLSIILAYVEALFPVLIAVPGVKLGLANITTLILLYKYDVKSTILFVILRVFIAGILFSGMAGIVYGLTGGVLSIVAMSIAKKCGLFSTIGISIIGGIAHNIGQIIMAIVLMESASILYYLPILICSGTMAGIAVGYLSYMVYKVTKNMQG